MPTISSPVFDLPSENGGKDFGIFMPIANGGWILSTTAPKIDGSYDYNRRAALLAEEIGLDFIMSMAKFRGYGGANRQWDVALDSTVLMSALAAQTKRVKIWTTFQTLLHNPAVVAKMIATLDQVSNGRAGLNVVPGAFRDEFAQMGVWPETLGHDARYDYAAEWMEAIRRLWEEDGEVTLDGTYVRLDRCISEPKPLQKPRPFIVAAGQSEKGMEFAIHNTDALFIGGRDDAEMRAISRRAKEKARAAGRRLRTYAMAIIVQGETDAEADAMMDVFRDGFDAEGFRNMLRAYGVIDAEIGKENAMTARARTGFMAPHIAGSAETIVRRIEQIIDDTDLDGLMLIFPDYEDGLKKLARNVLPALRARYGA
ncbi:LLM class flavin-dependent oxidoreductase [Acidomonas methanolica]|uniref:Pyrimidine monooxygenase RutA n=1 Tax=Acidomonas methanolica NBRC 104435 TaxID=1231351 RepID=A0A023D6X6_ACIMT|nr:LLM class flavin-dependent oxidoreductase [Acidomonas methanolica]MBU2654640.1 LLM class flavin-dependent oxidoreductase [Acidomonas methanolica]TCS27360.1 pyrimidine oxygenase [Acidomonas methanolica]GAJ29556.1 pyrimidine monooxygenase RutA [Acidomonas methanolica NBRC 104435]GBQ47702.1 luciferase family protein [Acidomonas methanolica]GEK99615.1 luciferase [Acidomonas methanolica NBRC 104435]